MTECEQCGRRGGRGFSTIPPVLVDWMPGGAFWTTPVTVCAAKRACWRRRPEPTLTEDAA